MSGAPRWDVEGRDWPNRDASKFVTAGGPRWHVQQMGEGPVLLLLHGTGAATHSWRGVMPLLVRHFTVIAPDLPGHGFTTGRPQRGMGLPGMAAAVAALLEALAVRPAMVAGHSAGVAIAARLALDKSCAVPIIGFNPALLPFPGLAAKLFPTLAKLLFVNPFAASIFARIARAPGGTERFLARATGSTIDREGLRCYETLFGNSTHCAGAIAMMANWDLERLERELPNLIVPVMLAHGEADEAIPLSAVRKAGDLIPGTEIELLDELGHLAHEERPDLAADLILSFAGEHAILDIGAATGG